jgi:drug/metabolite transporter (DMT)-like permease
VSASPTAARVSILAAGLLFSTAGAAVKACQGLGGAEIAGLRSLIAAAVIYGLLPETRRRPDRGVLLAALAYAAMLTLFATSNKLTTAANAVFLQSTAPLYVLLLGPWLLGEHARRRDLPVLAMLGCGMALFFVAADTPSATAPDPALGNALATASGLAWALTLMGLRALGKRASNAAAQAAAVGNLLAFAINLPFMDPERIATAAALDWAILAWLGVFQVGLAYVLIARAVPRVPAFEVTLLLMSEPAFNPLWAFALHAEVPASLALLGGLVICGALLFKAWQDRRIGR